MNDTEDIKFGDKRYLEGYKLILTHAVDLMKSADILAGKKKYGIANSIMIIAAEELIKSYFTIMMYLDPDSITNEFEYSFKFHKFKLESIKGMKEWGDYFKIIGVQLYGPLLSLPKGTSAAEIEKVKNASFNRTIKSLKSKKRKKRIKTENEWWVNAQSKKEMGMYVNKKDMQWKIPREIKKPDYIQTKGYVTEFYGVVKMMGKLFEMPEEIFFQFVKSGREFSKKIGEKTTK